MSYRVVDGNTAVVWADAIDDVQAPTDDELTAAVRLEGWLTRDGLDVPIDQADVDTTSLNSTSETKQFGKATVNPALTLKRAKAPTPDTAWVTFADEPEGFLVIRRGVASDTAFAAAQKVEVYPAIASKRMPVNPGDNEVEKFTVKLGLTGNHVEEAAVVAAP